MWRKRGVLNSGGGAFSVLDYDRAYQIQQGRCKMCGVHQAALAKPLVADHDHKTGKFRGLLCDDCNRSLGYYEKVKKYAEHYLGGL